MTKIVKSSTTGFPELLPEFRALELKWIETIEATFKSFGFFSIDTPSVEKLSVLLSKSQDTDKEIYAVQRIQDITSTKPTKLGLRYDLTIPMARYISDRYNDLTFPFKRYQIQKVWRGERPQEGRYREFLQCDIDVVDRMEVSKNYDAEMIEIISEIFRRIEFTDIEININNRKILEGFYRGLGISNTQDVIRLVDKIEKLGSDGVKKSLVEEFGLNEKDALKCINLAEIKTNSTSFVDTVKALGVTDELLTEGLNELTDLLKASQGLSLSVVANLSIARGFDYYTGSVFEGKLTKFPNFPTVLAGGRYSDLIGNLINQKLPGVGISIGLSRLLYKLIDEGLAVPVLPYGAEVLIISTPDLSIKNQKKIAEMLRSRGIKTESYFGKADVSKQLKYATKKKIRYAMFINDYDNVEIKDLESRNQEKIDPSSWCPSS